MPSPSASRCHPPFRRGGDLLPCGPCRSESSKRSPMGRITLDLARPTPPPGRSGQRSRVFEQYGTTAHAPDQVRRAIAGDEPSRQPTPIAQLVARRPMSRQSGTIDYVNSSAENGDRWSDPEIAQGWRAAIMEAEAKRLGEEAGPSLGCDQVAFRATSTTRTRSSPRQPSQQAMVRGRGSPRPMPSQTRNGRNRRTSWTAVAGCYEAGPARLEAEYDKLERRVDELQ